MASLLAQSSSYSLLSRRAWDGQAKVRSTTHRRGSTRRSEEHTSELQSHVNLVCRLLLEKKKEHAEFPERGGVAKDERAGHQAEHAARTIPQRGDDSVGALAGFEAYGAAAGEALAGGDVRGDVIEERGAGVCVGVDEDEPIAGGGAGAAIARAADLVDVFFFMMRPPPRSTLFPYTTLFR